MQQATPNEREWTRMRRDANKVPILFRIPASLTRTFHDLVGRAVPCPPGSGAQRLPAPRLRQAGSARPTMHPVGDSKGVRNIQAKEGAFATASALVLGTPAWQAGAKGQRGKEQSGGRLGGVGIRIRIKITIRITIMIEIKTNKMLGELAGQGHGY